MTKYNTLLRKVNQAGSMMIEALAMLTLISLVTPTLYKKSAERTTELQDINTATQIRTLTKAVDNYTLTNYQALITDLNKQPDSEKAKLVLSGERLSGYLPYGFELKPTRNFDTPVVMIKRSGGDSDALTSFIFFPKKGDISDYRASQIASMIGANGGYITEENDQTVAKGVGGVWSLKHRDLDDMFEGTSIPARGTLVAASSESINAASLQDGSNDKYLQRTPADGEEWRNTMMTDLYMGGVTGLLEGPGTIPLSKILGVDQLIIGDVQTSGDVDEENADLVVKSHDRGGVQSGGSAFIDGSIHALGKMFSVFKNADGNPELNFTDNDMKSMLNVTKDHFTVKVTSRTERPEDDLIIGRDENNNLGATLNISTTVNDNLTVVRDVALATDLDATLKVGPDGNVLSADKYAVNIQEGNFVVSNGSLTDELSNTLIATDTVNIKGDTKISDAEEGEEEEPLHEDFDPKLNVQGNAFISKTLEAGEIDAHKFDTMRLHAGGVGYGEEVEEKEIATGETYTHYDRWLNVNADGVEIRDMSESTRDHDGKRHRRLVVDKNESLINGPWFKDANEGNITRGAMGIGATNAYLQGVEQATLSTSLMTGRVSIQNDAIIAQSQPGDEGGNLVDVHATRMHVLGSDGQNVAFEVQAGEGETDRTKSYIDSNVDQFMVRKGETKLLNIVSDENGAVLEEDSRVEIDPKKFRIWAKELGDDGNKKILEVNAETGAANKAGDGEKGNDASVYVRRGAIELESLKAPVSREDGAKYAADEGVGYIEASRFVANNLQSDGKTIARPYFARGNDFDQGVLYDRYVVNPAYTSVMHDIKLTTRGGARLSDILPDFINKGIYIVNNTYKDGINFNELTVSNNGGVISASGAQEIDEGDTFSGQWASPFMGMVPAPQCPPGHARVITLTPASFQMAQAGDMILNSDGRYYVSEEIKVNKLGNYAVTQDDESGATMVAAPLGQNVIIQKGRPDGSNENMHLYYLGMAPDTHVSDGHSPTYEQRQIPKPLYFQQSTWLKSKVVAYAGSACTGSQASNGGCEGFMGWATVMGFIYPYELYKPIIDDLKADVSAVDKAEDSLASNKVYWNIFPVRPRSMEAYATVYCYFDRTNIFGSGNNPEYVDQYDQLNNFRNIKKKDEVGTVDQGTKGSNKKFIERLNDPQLKYDDPW